MTSSASDASCVDAELWPLRRPLGIRCDWMPRTIPQPPDGALALPPTKSGARGRRSLQAEGIKGR